MIHSRNIYYKYLLCAKGCARCCAWCCAYRFQSPSPRPPGTPRLRGEQGALRTEKRKEITRPREGFWAELWRRSEQGAGVRLKRVPADSVLGSELGGVLGTGSSRWGGRSGNQACSLSLEGCWFGIF